MVVSGEQQRNSAIHVHVSILPQTPLPSRLSYNIEQSSMSSTYLRFKKFFFSKKESKFYENFVRYVYLTVEKKKKNLTGTNVTIL